jgi:uncharacterized protein YndB with AHSA1/START domain
MNSKNQTNITKDAGNKKIFVVRNFDAPLEEVWRAWTERDLLDQWWAPKPWKAVTISMDCCSGGMWHYYMQGPDGSRHYSRADYVTVSTNEAYEALTAFCDGKGNINHEFGQSNWKVRFGEASSGTKVNVEITFASADVLEKFIEMGFKEGFTMAHSNLDELLVMQKV